MKKIAAIFVLIFIIGGWSVSKGDSRELDTALGNDIDLLKRAFATTEAIPRGAEISGWAEISTNYFPPREAEAAVEKMAEEFELYPAEYAVILRSTGHYGYAIVEYELSEDTWLRLQIQSLDNQTIASVEVRQKHHRNLNTVYEQVISALLRVGAEREYLKITSCLEGYVDARLRDSDILDTVYGVFNSIEAVYQEGMDAEGVAVWSGWSPLFSQSISSGCKNVNLGIAFRWDSGSRGTIVRLATPVLPGSY